MSTEGFPPHTSFTGSNAVMIPVLALTFAIIAIAGVLAPHW